MAKVAIQSHKELRVWQKAVSLAIEVYNATKIFPAEERFGLTAQMRRSAVSVASNISEGAARQSAKEFLHFLHVARGSLAELETQLEMAGRLGLIPGETELVARLDEVGKTLTGLIKRIRSNLAVR